MKEISEEEYIERTEAYGGKIFQYLRKMEVGQIVLIEFDEWAHRSDFSSRVGWYNRKNNVYLEVNRDKNEGCWVVKRIR